jgi:hypothetical protein
MRLVNGPDRKTIAGQIDRMDPVALVFAVHAVVLVATDSVESSVAVAGIAALLVVARFTLGLLVRRSPTRAGTVAMARSVVSTVLVGAAVVADGGTESPLFFWFLILLAWEGLISSRFRLVALCAVAAVTYVAVIFVADDVTAASVGRFGLFITFMLVLVAGRTVLDEYETRVLRMDSMVATLVHDMPMAVAVFDADRDTVLYANGAARVMGLNDRDAMARLIPAGIGSGGEAAAERGISSLAWLIERGGWEPMQPQIFRSVGGPKRTYRIGFHPRRLESGAPILLVYGEEVPES